MRTYLENFFKLKEHQTDLKTEFLAGLTSFSTVAYIIFINPLILSEVGMDFGSVMVATILSMCVATLIMGLFANYPFALGPGLGLNAFFTYGIVLSQGHTWEQALGACFFAGVGLFILNLLGIRQMIMEAIPASLRNAIAGGIGLLLAFIALKNIHLIIPNENTLITLGDIRSPEVLLTALGLSVITALMALKFRGAILVSILLNWFIGLLFGLVEWQGFFAPPPSLAPTFLKLDLLGALQLPFLPIILSFIFVAVFDMAGTLLALADQGNFLDEKGHLPRARKALFSDSCGTMVGALLGTSPFTTYLESASGIAAGGRTGLTSVFISAFFLLSLFLSPFALSIPHFATAPVLIVIGALMVMQLKQIPWDDPTEFIPAFIILITIPLTFSIATGIALGFIVYPTVKLLSGKKEQVSLLVWMIAAFFALKFAFA